MSISKDKTYDSSQKSSPRPLVGSCYVWGLVDPQAQDVRHNSHPPKDGKTRFIVHVSPSLSH